MSVAIRKINNLFFSRKNRRNLFIFLLVLLFPVLSLSAQKNKLTIVQCTDQSTKWVMINSNGLEIYQIYALGENPDSFNEGLMRIIQNDKIGFINRKGKIVIRPAYCQATSFFKGKCIVNVNATKIDKSTTDAQNATLWEGGQWGVIDKKGNVVKPFEYTREWSDSAGTYLYKKIDEVFIFTPKGKIQTFKLIVG